MVTRTDYAIAVLVILWAIDMAKVDRTQANWREAWVASGPARFARHRRAALIASETLAGSSERFTP